jgi:hypothetical protein
MEMWCFGTDSGTRMCVRWMKDRLLIPLGPGQLTDTCLYVNRQLDLLIAADYNRPL